MFDDERREFDIVVNHEEQFSIWPAGRDIPTGWHAVGTRGTKAECLTYIDQAWTDMRPLSLREQMKADRVVTRAA
jgi:MbtH protein